MFNTTIRDMCGDDPWWSHLAWSCLDYDLLPPQGFFLLFFVDATVVHTMQAGNERSKSFKIHRLASTEALNQPQNDLDDDEEPIRWSTDSAFFFLMRLIVPSCHHVPSIWTWVKPVRLAYDWHVLFCHDIVRSCLVNWFVEKLKTLHSQSPIFLLFRLECWSASIFLSQCKSDEKQCWSMLPGTMSQRTLLGSMERHWLADITRL